MYPLISMADGDENTIFSNSSSSETSVTNTNTNRAAINLNLLNNNEEDSIEPATPSNTSNGATANKTKKVQKSKQNGDEEGLTNDQVFFL